MLLKNNFGYNISCSEHINESNSTIIIAMHGFAGDKTSGCIKKLQEVMHNHNVGLITFDWPSHGESEVDGNNLTVVNCLNDLKTVYDYVKNKVPRANIVAFATSFGGYITMLYNSIYPEDFNKIILRAPAINMYRVLMNNVIDDKMISSLKNNGYFDFGFERMMKVNKDFVSELQEKDVSKLYSEKQCLNVHIIHGSNDDIVPISDSKEFCISTGASLHIVHNANHRFDQVGQVEEVIELAKGILLCDE